jgi:hypothetical protein
VRSWPICVFAIVAALTVAVASRNYFVARK